MTPTRAWAWLLLLTAGSTLAAATGLGGALVVLALAAAKARIILAAYLGLQQAPAWQRGFDLGLGLMVATMAVLALA